MLQSESQTEGLQEEDEEEAREASGEIWWEVAESNVLPSSAWREQHVNVEQRVLLEKT